MPETTPAAPVAAGERLPGLDLLRGIAVLGILLANIVAFAHVDLAYYWPGALPGGGNAADRWVWLAQFVLVDGKLRGLFTVLFGAGMVLFVERLGGDERAVLLQARRLAVLLPFALAHFYLLFNGDILFSYACAGLLGLLALRLEGQRLLVLGLIWGVTAALFDMLAYLTPALVEAAGSNGTGGVPEVYRAHWQQQLADAARQAQVMMHGSYADVLRYRLVEDSDRLVSSFTWIFFETIPLMLIGMGLYRLGVFAPRPPGTPREGQGMAWAAFLAGLAANLAVGVFVLARGFPPYLTQLAFFGLLPLANVPMITGGAVLLARWAAVPGDGWLAERLGQAGRMALTNYIGTSLVMMLLFQGWAGGLYGTLHRLDLLLVVALGWALMLSFSRFWLRRFRQGPLEWLWRCLTYGRLFPNRLRGE